MLPNSGKTLQRWWTQRLMTIRSSSKKFQLWKELHYHKTCIMPGSNSTTHVTWTWQLFCVWSKTLTLLRAGRTWMSSRMKFRGGRKKWSPWKSSNKESRQVLERKVLGQSRLLLLQALQDLFPRLPSNAHSWAVLFSSHLASPSLPSRQHLFIAHHQLPTVCHFALGTYPLIS